MRLSAIRERLRVSLWLWPSVAVTSAIAAGLLLPLLEGTGNDTLGIAGTPDGARAVLSTVAGSMITVTGLVFSLTVLALQMASSQFTPRLLRTFLSDGGNQAVLSTFLGTFAYSLTVLRSIRSPSEGQAFVPDVAVTVGLALTLLSVGMLVYFFHHLTQQLRVESILKEVTGDTTRLIGRSLSSHDDTTPTPPPVPDNALPLKVRKSGYLQAADAQILLSVATDLGLSIRLRPAVGTHLTEGSTLGWAWPDGPDPAVQLDAEGISKRAHDGVQIGSERTLQQDIGFGLRQLVDIAAKALSPGVNDPTTAVAALHALAEVMGELCGQGLGPVVTTGEEGHTVVVPRPTYGELLALACDQPRRYGRDEPAVLGELLHLLTDLAETATVEEERAAVCEQIEATTAALSDTSLSAPEERLVRELAHHAEVAAERGRRPPEDAEVTDEPAA
ncbi:DUF2254 domain-containing protein [soil metagenome]